MIQRIFTLTTKIKKLELPKKKIMLEILWPQFLLSTEYALKKSRKVSKINGLGSLGSLIKQKQIQQINNQIPFQNSVPSFSFLVVDSFFLSEAKGTVSTYVG